MPDMDADGAVWRAASLPTEPPRTVQHPHDEPRTDDRFLLDQRVAWSRVGVAVGAFLFAAMFVLALFPHATVDAIEAVAEQFR